jgi:hypothetical protein
VANGLFELPNLGVAIVIIDITFLEVYSLSLLSWLRLPGALQATRQRTIFVHECQFVANARVS